MENLKFKIKHKPLKRTFDIIFSLLALLCCLPIFLIIALAIRLNSRGTIIYSQERIGRGGKPFRCYKFRTMYPDAENRLHELLKTDAKILEEWKANRKLKKDPRITPIGHFLRKTSLDEFLQFWNVFKGDLSIVGPRPVLRDEVTDYYGEKAVKILSVRPGLTCIWQVSGRSDTSYPQRIKLDEQYIDNHSFMLDMRLIAKTIPSILSSKGAY